MNAAIINNAANNSVWVHNQYEAIAVCAIAISVAAAVIGIFWSCAWVSKD